MDVWAGATPKGYWASEIRVRFPNLADGWVFAETYARHNYYPQEDYFGLGPDSLRSNQADFTLRSNIFGGRAGVRPYRDVEIGGERNRHGPHARCRRCRRAMRGGRWSDTPRTQAALAINRGLCPRGIAPSLGPADGRAGIGSEPEVCA